MYIYMETLLTKLNISKLIRVKSLKKVGTGDTQVQLLGSGTILREVEKAAQMLAVSECSA
jgi:pyruvate dehydrogenase complex dehydrogenase (E1) component